MEEMNINGKRYIEVSELNKDDQSRVCSIVRTYSAGLFIGYVGEINGMQNTIYNSRRIYYWAGALSASELAVNVTTDIEKWKICVVVPEVTLLQCIEIIPCNKAAADIIMGAESWKG